MSDSGLVVHVVSPEQLYQEHCSSGFPVSDSQALFAAEMKWEEEYVPS